MPASKRNRTISTPSPYITRSVGLPSVPLIPPVPSIIQPPVPSIIPPPVPSVRPPPVPSVISSVPTSGVPPIPVPPLPTSSVAPVPASWVSPVPNVLSPVPPPPVPSITRPQVPLHPVNPPLQLFSMSLEDFIGVIRNVVQQERDANQPPPIISPSIVPGTPCSVPAPVTFVPAVTPLTSRVFHVYMCLFVVAQ